MNLGFTVLVFASFVLLICDANKDFKKDNGVKAIKGSPISITNEAEDGDGRAPACVYQCPGGRWCCNYGAPLCVGNGYCCPLNRPNLWGAYCY